LRISSISSYAKKARGLMLNYIIKNNITNIDDLKNFSLENYSLNLNLSNKNNFIFTR